MRNLKTMWQRFSRRAAKRKAQPGVQADEVASLSRLLRLVAQTQEKEFSCDDVYRLLDQFTEAAACGKDAARLMPFVQQHLDLCQDCREEFEALLRILKGYAT